jgi:hypothetical protein
VALRQTLANFYLCWFSQPKSDRDLYRCVRQQRVQRIVEVGIVSLQRTTRLIELAQRMSPGQEIHYAGIDPFDARPASMPRLLLKETHRHLSNRSARVRLIPGEPQHALVRSANQLAATQLLILAPELDSEAMEAAWAYVPRMLDATCWIWEGCHTPQSTRYVPVRTDVIRQRAEAATRRRRAA